MLILNTEYSEENHKKVELGLNKLSKDLQPMFVRFMKTLPMTQARFIPYVDIVNGSFRRIHLGVLKFLGLIRSQ